MPTYTYQCQKCAHMKDEWRKMADRNEPSTFCEKCGGPDVIRIMSAPGFAFTDGGHNGEYGKTGPRKDFKK